MKVSYDDVNKLLDYNPDTGVFIWKARNNKSWNSRFVSMEAGTIRFDENSSLLYKRICIYNKKYQAHQLAYFIMTKTWAPIIDHINRDSLDNSWNNLRKADKSLNARNSKLYSNNISGYRCISWNKRKQKWRMRIYQNGKAYITEFFNTIEESILFRNQKYLELYGEEELKTLLYREGDSNC